MHTFIAVAKNAGVTAAANTPRLTQGTTGQQTKQLEDIFECRLFERDSRRLELTHTGEQLPGRAKRLLTLNDEIWADVTTRPLQGPIRLGVPYDLVGTALLPIFKTFIEAQPSVELTIVCGTSPELMEHITHGELDVAMIETPVDEVTGKYLRMGRLTWVGPRGGNMHMKRPLPLSMVDEDCASRARAFKALGEHGIERRMVFKSNNIEVTTATICTGLAVVAWPVPMMSADLNALKSGTGLPELPISAISLLLSA